MESPAIEGVDEGEVFIIRHGMSVFNLMLLTDLEDQLDRVGPQWLAMKSNPLLVDPDLNEIGITQCLNSAPKLHEINFV